MLVCGWPTLPEDWLDPDEYIRRSQGTVDIHSTVPCRTFVIITFMRVRQSDVPLWSPEPERSTRAIAGSAAVFEARWGTAPYTPKSDSRTSDKARREYMLVLRRSEHPQQGWRSLFDSRALHLEKRINGRTDFDADTGQAMRATYHHPKRRAPRHRTDKPL